MDTHEHQFHDLVGVGFGPSNLSLAIALEERQSELANMPLSAAFFERQPSFSWHRNMLLPSTTMQISFLKDLATLRNPTSRFSFISYLHTSGRLVAFVNNQDFFPTRQEFHHYLEWAGAEFANRVSYGTEVTAIRLPALDGQERPDYMQIEARNGNGCRIVNARNVVISTGIEPRLPEGIELSEHIWHSSEFLDKYQARDPAELKNVAVVGAGQSAAEITRFLYDALPAATVSAILPSYGYSIADDTPFANQVFDPSAVDDYYFGTPLAKDVLWQYHKNTNYSVVDSEVIRDIYRRVYEEQVRNVQRLRFHKLTRVVEAKQAGSLARVTLESALDGEMQTLEVDALVLATGYKPMDLSCLLGALDGYCVRDSAGRHLVDRDYRLVTRPDLPFGIYLQGGTEHTHGLSSSLLSNIAIRSGEIIDSIVRRQGHADPAARRQPRPRVSAPGIWPD